MEYISVKEAALKWNISERRVLQYCKEQRIPGLQRFGRSWAIPEDADKPLDPRKNWQDAPSRKTSENKHSKTVGAVITVAGKYDDEKGISPFISLGTTSLIRRLVLIFQQANVFPIVIITGYQSLEVQRHLANYGVIFLENPDYETSDKMQSIRMGLDFIKDKCNKVFFASLKNPIFLPDTLKEMIDKDYMITVPTYTGKHGHPVLLDAKVIPSILEYQGNDGMRGAIRECPYRRKFIEVNDKGILLRAENLSRLDEIIEEFNNQLWHPFIQLSLEKESPFFDARAKLLLLLIQDFHSVQSACKQMALSRSKAWEIIAQMENALGFTVVKRRQGGGRTRKTELTEKGEHFLNFYLEYEKTIKNFAIEEFEKQFKQFKNEL
jgi:molybdate transport repressor ModE-like protein